jgi:hypothetical protein
MCYSMASPNLSRGKAPLNFATTSTVPVLLLHRTRTGSFEPDSIGLRISVARTRLIIADDFRQVTG